MPTYVYKFVETGETIEVQQSFTDDSLTQLTHPDSGEVMAVKKVFQPVGVTFKGSGFFKTDNRGSASSTSSSAASGTDSSSGSSNSGTSSSDSSAASGSSAGKSAGSGDSSSGSASSTTAG